MANICDTHKNTLGKAIKEFTDFSSETFDISGKVDTNNPIYKFYEKEVGKYLKNKYGATLVTDPQGVKWWEVDLKGKGFEKAPVEAFGVGAGVQVDEEGNVSFSPESAALGVAAVAGVSKFGKKVPQTFRADKLDISAETAGEVQKRLMALGFDQRSVRSFEDMVSAAQDLGTKDVDSLIKEVSTNRITDAEVIALRNTISSKSNEVIQLEKALEIAPEQTQRILNIQLSEANTQLDKAIRKLVKGGTEAGRAVASFRIQARNTLDPSFWLSKAQRQLGTKELTQDHKIAILKLIENKDITGLANFLQMLRVPSLAEKAVTFWKAGLLTSPTTQFANIAGNLTMTSLMTLSDVASTGADVLAALATGKRTTTISPSSVVAKVRGFKTGAKGAVGVLRDGTYSPELLKKYDVRQVNYGDTSMGKVLNGYTQAIFRMLSASDVLFRGAALEESLVKTAEVIATNEKLKGDAFKQRVKELLQNPTVEMQLNAIDAAEYATFQRENKLANSIQSAKRAGGDVVGTSLEILAPFVKTPTNIAATIIDFSPAGFLTTLIKTLRTKEQKDLVEGLGRAITGTAIIGLGAILAEKGLMTGNTPTNPGEREDFYAEGKQRNSIKLGNTWYRLDKLSPLGNLLSLGAEFNQLDKEKNGVDLAISAFASGAKGLTEQTFLKGISGGLQALNDPERSAQLFVQQSISSVIPSVVGRVARTIDPTLRRPENIFESLQARTPFTTENIAPRIDVFGNEVTTPGGRLNLIDPFSSSEATPNKIINEAHRLGLVVGLPSQTVSGTKLTNREYALYQKIQGKVLEQMLGKLIEDGGYKSASDDVKEKLFESVKREVRAEVNDAIFPQIMIKRYDLEESTDPQVLRALLSELNKKEEFTEMLPDRQGRVLKKLLKQ